MPNPVKQPELVWGCHPSIFLFERRPSRRDPDQASAVGVADLLLDTWGCLGFRAEPDEGFAHAALPTLRHFQPMTVMMIILVDLSF